MAGIEFLDPVEPPPSADERLHDTRRRGSPLLGRPAADLAHLASSVLLLLAAALTTVATFRSVVVFGFGGEQFSYRADTRGWGRIEVSVRGETSVSHGPRYGVGLTVAAGLLVVAAVLIAVHVLRAGRRAGGPPVRRPLAGLVVGSAGGALLVGALGTVLLTVRADYDNLVASTKQVGGGSGGGEPRPTLDFTLGWFVWLALIAVAVIVVALALLAVPRRAVVDAGPQPEPPTEPQPQPEPLTEPVSGRASEPAGGAEHT